MTGDHQHLCEYAGHETPHEAEYGRLCPWCWQRLHADIIDVPTTIDHLLDMAAPSARPQELGTTGWRGDPAEKPILSSALDTAHELHAQIAHLSTVVAKARGLRGPDDTGWWRSQTTLAYDPDTNEPYLKRAQVVGFHGGSGPSRKAVQWLLPHLLWVAEQQWGPTVRQELAELMATTRARWPMAERRVRDIPDVECPRCDVVGLQFAPPSWYRAPFQITCTNPRCGRVFAEDEWSRLVGLLDLIKRRKL